MTQLKIQEHLDVVSKVKSEIFIRFFVDREGNYYGCGNAGQGSLFYHKLSNTALRRAIVALDSSGLMARSEFRGVYETGWTELAELEFIEGAAAWRSAQST